MPSFAMNCRYALFILVLLLSGYNYSSAQGGSGINGTIVDNPRNTMIDNVTVSVISAKDSILVEFSYSKPNGTFEVTNLAPGSYIVVFSHPDYAEYAEPIRLDKVMPYHSFGKVKMRLKVIVLDEVIIKAKTLPVKLKGDTTEFHAGSYVIQPNDKVEDLLKQLPGIQVDRNGKITAQGQVVSLVLLDGEEFFGDDPKLITKNVRADMVDKVQLYDKKSDQATFTGIQDGIKTKTLNIKLKEDKKKGLFGKGSVGIGSSGYYESQAMVNKFNTSSKLSAYSTFANNGKIGLGSGDRGKLGTSSVQIGPPALISSSSQGSSLESYSGAYDGTGYPSVKMGGVHFDGKWDENRQSINTNYQIGSITVNGKNSSSEQQSMPSKIVNTDVAERFDNHAFRQKLDFVYRVALDQTTNLKVSTAGEDKSFRLDNSYSTTSSAASGGQLNTQNRDVANKGDESSFNASLFLTKKLKKERRTLSFELEESYKKYSTAGYLNSVARFAISSGSGDSLARVSQFKTILTKDFAIAGNITYTEPLSKYFSAVMNYRLVVNNSSAKRNSFNQASDQGYSVLDTIFSNNFNFDQVSNSFGVSVNFFRGGTSLNFGTGIAKVLFRQNDLSESRYFKRNFLFWTPKIFFRTELTRQSAISFTYRASNTQPGIDQLQPVRSNLDPLNITVGNPNLKPSFVNNFNASYNINNSARQQSMLIQADYSRTNSAIINRISFDPVTGKSLLGYENISGVPSFNFRAFAALDKKIIPWDLDLNITLDSRGGSSFNRINEEINRSGSYTYAASIGLGKSKKDRYNVFLSGGPTYSRNVFSLQQDYNNNSGGFSSNVSVRFYLPFGFSVSSDANYLLSNRTQRFDQQSRTILNASLNKVFLKQKNLKLSASGYDLLDQNVQFTRFISGNRIVQADYATIRRYFMLSVVWDFTKFGRTD